MGTRHFPCSVFAWPPLGSKAGIVHILPEGGIEAHAVCKHGALGRDTAEGILALINIDFSLQEWLHNLQGPWFKNY